MADRDVFLSLMFAHQRALRIRRLLRKAGERRQELANELVVRTEANKYGPRRPHTG